MKKTVLTLGILMMSAGLVFAQVTVYEGKKFTGKSYKVSEKEGLSIYDDMKVASIKVDWGWNAAVYYNYSDDPDRSFHSLSESDFVAEVDTRKPVFISFGRASEVPNTLKGYETLYNFQYLVSTNEKFILRMQKDGHLCIYKFDKGTQGAFVWGSGKHGFKDARLVLQEDGNLVIYDGNDTARWHTGTHPFHNAKFKDSKYKPVKMVLEDDGSLKLYSASGAVVWTNK